MYFKFDKGKTLCLGGVIERIHGKEYEGFIGSFLGPFEKGVHAEIPPKCLEKRYNKAEQDITKILGKKERYNLEEAIHFFQTKYGAYRVPFAYHTWYEDAVYQEKFDPIDAWFQTKVTHYPDAYEPDDEYQTEYIDMREKNSVTLVIDTVYNEQLRKRYPDIAKVEKLIQKYRQEAAEEYLHFSKDEKLDSENREEAYNRYQKRIQNLTINPNGHRNVIIHIGNILGQLGTMHTCNTLYPHEDEYNTPLMELQYEIWFFFRHH